MEKRTAILPAVLITIPTMLVGMWLFQKLKFFFLPTMTLALSHMITIVFNTVLATTAVYFIVRNRETLINRLFEEIGNRRQFEEALQESEERYRRIVETAYEGIWILDREMKITYLNQRMAEIYGYSIPEMMGCHLFEFHDEKVREQVQRKMESLHRGVTKQFDICTRRKDGSELWTMVNATPIMDADNGFVGLLGMSTDITKRKHAEMTLQSQKGLLRDLSARLAEVSESERKRLAAELHDLVGQNLTALGINLKIAENTISPEMFPAVHSRLLDSTALMNDTIESIRNVITDLRPSTLDDFGLPATIRWYGELFSQRTGIAVTMRVEELSPRLPAQVENTLFRIFQESLVNVQKHAHAREVTVAVEENEKDVRLTISDDGIGFDVAGVDASPVRKGWGLVTMNERAMAAAGSFSIASSPGQGTRIRVEVKR